MTADLSNLVVEVLHNRGDDNDPDWSVGSGFFVGTRLVLTALHNVDGQGELLIRVHGKEEYPALLRLQGDKDIVDLAMLEVPDVAVDVPPLRYGTVDRSAPAVVEGCRAVGFPGFKERVHNLKPQRFSAQVDGEIPTGENLDQPLLTLQVRRSPRPLPSSVVRESEWAGMSGAMVFSGNIIVGVITEHHLPEGESALTVVPITAIDLLSEATKWWELLGVDRQAFVRLPGEAPTSLSISARPESFIPIPHSPLVQPRPDEFENLERLLFGSKRENPSPRLGLVGMAGVGKTQLAVELAHRCLAQNRFPAGIFWMTALGKDLNDWQPRFAQLARDTGYVPPNDDVSSAENERRRAIHFCRYLADHQDALLILDNIEDPSLVMTALPTLVGREVACSILYTSRITLSPEGATTYPVEPLSQENALRLLLQETREPLLTQIEAKLPNAEAKNARDLCQSVGYLPLALKQLHDLLRRDRHLTLARLLEALAQRGALKLIQPLFPTFQLSWEQVQGEDAQRLFKLACYFPEAAPIPLWLLGLAAGLGEEGDILTQLGEARVELQELSLMEELSGDQVRLHPLVREFGLRLVEGAGDKGKTLLEEAEERLTTECTNLNNLEARALRAGYLGCLEQVRAARQYLEQIAPTQAGALTRIEHWLDQESYLLADGAWWPKRLVGLFYQQLFNHSVETGQPLKAAQAPVSWVRQREPAGREYPALVRIFAGHTGGVHGVAFSPDGRQVLTGSQDQTAQLWDAASGRELARFGGHTDGVSSVAFSPDGRLAIICSGNGHIYFWQVIPPDVGSLVGMYVASYRVEAMHWQDARHITLADSGGPYGRPYFYHLTLEGM